MSGVKSDVLKQLDLWEYYVLDVEAHQQPFMSAWKQSEGGSAIGSIGSEQLAGRSLDDGFNILQNYALIDRMALSARFVTHVDISIAVKVYRQIGQGHSDEEVFAAFRSSLDKINAPLYATYDEDYRTIVSNLAGRLRYQRLDSHGPLLGAITKS